MQQNYIKSKQKAGDIFYLVMAGGPCNGWGWSTGNMKEDRRCWAASARGLKRKGKSDRGAQEARGCDSQEGTFWFTS